LAARTQDIPASVETNSFRITVTDSGPTSTNATVTIDIVDDLPTITANSLGIANVANTYTGHYEFNVGADSQPFASSFDSAALQWINPGSGYTLQYDSGASNATTRVYAGVDGSSATFFTVAVHSDGTYDFNLVNPAPVTTTNVASVLAGISGGSNLASYTIDSTNFSGAFNLVLTGYSGASHAVDTLTISSSDLGVGDNVMQGNKSDVLRFDVQKSTRTHRLQAWMFMLLPRAVSRRPTPLTSTFTTPMVMTSCHIRQLALISWCKSLLTRARRWTGSNSHRSIRRFPSRSMASL